MKSKVTECLEQPLTPLELAVSKNNLIFAKKVFEYQDVDPNARNSDRKTLLYLACSCINCDKSKSKEMIEFLIDKGADPEMTISSLFSFLDRPLYVSGRALHVAVDFGNVVAVRALLEGGHVDVNAKELFGPTALHIACSGPRLLSMEMIKLLVDHGANVNAFDGGRRRPLDYLDNIEGSARYVKYLESRGAQRGKGGCVIC